MKKIKQVLFSLIILVVLLNFIIPHFSCATVSYDEITAINLALALQGEIEEKIKERIAVDIQNGDENYTETKQFLNNAKAYTNELGNRVDVLCVSIERGGTEGITAVKEWIQNGMNNYFTQSYVDFLLLKITQTSDAVQYGGNFYEYSNYFNIAKNATNYVISLYYASENEVDLGEINNLRATMEEPISEEEQIYDETDRIITAVYHKIESLTTEDEEELINYIEELRREIETGLYSENVKNSILVEMDELFYTNGSVDVQKAQEKLSIFLALPPNTSLEGIQEQVGNEDDPLNDNFLTGILDGVLGVFLYPFKILLVVPGAIINLILSGIGAIGGDPGFVTLERIFFNNIEGENKLSLVDINIFEESESNALNTIKNSIAKFYIAFRNLAIVLSLAVLIYIGIRMAINSTAEDKAKYKSMITNWVVGFGLIFILHYIIVFTINANELLVRALYNGTTENWDFMNQLAIQVWWIPFTKSFASIIIYVALLFITCSFLIVYIKRLLTIAFLIIVAPLISVTYSIDKVGNNKSEILDTWLKNFFYNVLIQPFHCLIYLIFVSTGINLITESGSLDFGAMVLAIIFILSIYMGEKIIKEIFGFSQAKGLVEKVAVFALAKQTINNVRNIATIKGAANDKRASKKLKDANKYLQQDDKMTTDTLAHMRILAEQNRVKEDSKTTGQNKQNQDKNQISNKVQQAANNLNNSTKYTAKNRRPLKNLPSPIKRAIRGYKDMLYTTSGVYFAKNTVEKIKNNNKKKKIINMSDDDIFIARAEQYRQNSNKNLSNEELANIVEKLHNTDFSSLKSIEDINFKMYIEDMYKKYDKKGNDVKQHLKDNIMYGTNQNYKWRK